MIHAMPRLGLAAAVRHQCVHVNRRVRVSGFNYAYQGEEGCRIECGTDSLNNYEYIYDPSKNNDIARSCVYTKYPNFEPNPCSAD